MSATTDFLAEHRYVQGQQLGRICRCGWGCNLVGRTTAAEQHRRHIASLIDDLLDAAAAEGLRKAADIAENGPWEDDDRDNEWWIDVPGWLRDVALRAEDGSL